MPRIPVCLVSLVLALPGAALAGEMVIQFQTLEDPKAAADPNACHDAPFQANVKMQGSVSVPETSPTDGKVKASGKKPVGAALACLRITDRTFAEGSQGDIYASFELPEGHFEAVGKCTAVSNAVPRPGVVLAGCELKLTEFPRAYAGGFATSASLFNPLHLPGYSTGSMWTLRVFEPEAAPAQEPAKAKASKPAPSAGSMGTK
ncbi:hypothetical protein [Hyalangium gracile]|uniref:hypothetical protein n=1 Tax=Hyalangium gracile TaxID=394092 RepID=UPI001CCA9DA6|nr:hypothetical protein [Hyalangium gracile]